MHIHIISCLSSIELVFLPPNTTTEIRNQGIINASLMVKDVMDCTNSGQRQQDRATVSIKEATTEEETEKEGTIKHRSAKPLVQ